MDVNVKHGDILNIKTEAICLGIFQGVRAPGGAAGAVDRALGGALSALLKEGDFEGKKGELLFLRTEGKIPAKRVLLVGLGERERFTLDVAREASAAAAQAAGRFRELTTIVHGAGIGGLSPESAAQAVVEGAILGTYRFERYRQQREGPRLERLQLIEFDRSKLSEMEAGAKRGQIIAEAVCLARDLANEPAASLTPKELAERAEALAKEFKLQCQVLTENELKRAEMNGILGVARGSDEPPRLIVLEYWPQRAKFSEPIALIGKGVTFDSGGISIKPREGLEAMKYDMAGAAAVLGAMRALSALELPLPVVGLVPAVENLPSGKALRPGDILRFVNGKTVEVTNTDAEGRLILADALIYAQRYRPRFVIDLATLTGACVIALGKEAAGLFSNHAPLVERLKAASQKTGERVWELPLYEEYRELLKSEVADLKNSVLAKSGIPQAGAAAGAIFLQEFVSYPWAHLDIAGTAYDVETRAYCPKGATGYGVRLLTQLLLDEAQNSN